MRKKIGIITMGQSPRDDVVPEMIRFIENGVDVIEVGALDGLTLDEARAYAPGKDMTHLASRMQDGTEVILAKEKLLPRIEDAVKKLNQEQTFLILLMCVGRFPAFASECLIVEPQRVVDRCVQSLIGKQHHLGILIPVAQQEQWVRETFSPVTPQITVATASPYANPQHLVSAADRFKTAKCDLIVMYCMGFNRTLTKMIRETTGAPVISSSSIVARTMAELLQ